jgi:hypothetical protein
MLRVVLKRISPASRIRLREIDMDVESQHEREARAARNQALFRNVNEKLRELNDAFESVTSTFAIACECADTGCTGMLDISPEEYELIRSEPRHFAVLPGHVYADVETVVRELAAYVVVEKTGDAGEAAEFLDQRA